MYLSFINQILNIYPYKLYLFVWVLAIECYSMEITFCFLSFNHILLFVFQSHFAFCFSIIYKKLCNKLNYKKTSLCANNIRLPSNIKWYFVFVLHVTSCCGDFQTMKISLHHGKEREPVHTKPLYSILRTTPASCAMYV